MSTTQTTHTPGPWTYNHELADNGDKQTEMYGKSKRLNEAVCLIPHDDMTERGYEEVKSNARLIAAAPELLRELKSAIFYIETYGGAVTDSFSASGNMEDVKSIIAKAEGR